MGRESYEIRRARYLRKRSDPEYVLSERRRQKELRQKYPDKYKLYALHTKEKFYNLSLEEYNKLLEEQRNVCAICGLPELNRGIKKGKAILSIDHSKDCCPNKKSCGKCIRGLLCSNCNSALGYFKDNPDIMENAARYIRLFRNTKLPFSRGWFAANGGV